MFLPYNKNFTNRANSVCTEKSWASVVCEDLTAFGLYTTKSDSDLIRLSCQTVQTLNFFLRTSNFREVLSMVA